MCKPRWLADIQLALHLPPVETWIKQAIAVHVRSPEYDLDMMYIDTDSEGLIPTEWYQCPYRYRGAANHGLRSSPMMPCMYVPVRFKKI
jgi:hypothetical protein